MHSRKRVVQQAENVLPDANICPAQTMLEEVARLRKGCSSVQEVEGGTDQLRNRGRHTYLDLCLHSAFDKLKVLPWVEAVAVEADFEDAHVFLLHIYRYHHHGLWGTLGPA